MNNMIYMDITRKTSQVEIEGIKRKKKIILVLSYQLIVIGRPIMFVYMTKYNYEYKKYNE